MSAWVEGLLGAVMGGAQEYGNILKEEETAKRKEEEEKRKEERALSLREREREMERRRTEENERLKAEKMAKMLGPSTQMTPGSNPMEPEGIVESQIPFERRLVTAREEALSKGDVAAAKEFNEQYKALKQEERAQAKEGREQEEEARKQTDFERGPKPEKAPEAIRTMEAKIKATYKGALDESGNPVNSADYAAHRQAEIQKYVRKEQYISPERGAGPEGKPPTTADYGKARNTLQRDMERAATVVKDGKIIRDPELYKYINAYSGDVIKKDKDRVFDPNLAEEARSKVIDALDRAKADARKDLEKTTGNDGRPLDKELLRRNRQTLSNPESLKRYESENAAKYINRYLGASDKEDERPDPLGLRKR